MMLPCVSVEVRRVARAKLRNKIEIELITIQELLDSLKKRG